MKSKTVKIIIGIVVLGLIGAGVYASVRFTQRELVTVQTGKVGRGDLAAVVTASGEIKPRTYINLGANAQGRITELLVREGEHVRKDQVVARIENIQASADVAAQKAAVSSAEADSSASEVGIKVQDDSLATQVATIDRAKADLERTKVNLDRTTELYNSKLIARQEFDQKKAEYDSAAAAVREAQARLTQMQSQRAQIAAQLSATQRRIAQVQASLARAADVLAKHDVVAPINGLVTYLPVRVGETVVPGIQNSAASTILTIADMSLITAEVKVDETDIVNVKVGQQALITIDAIPNRTFPGHVIEIGNSAILRSSGLAASQSNTSSNEAKDFKVVVGIDDPPVEIRPGLSASVKITTSTRKEVPYVPIQALTVRTKGDLEEQPKEKGKETGPLDPAQEKIRKEEVQGIFVINGDKAEFRKVETGITGATDIEVLSGVGPGDQIVIGGYKVIRTMKNGARIKVDNKTPVSDGKS